jgi:hypothetical protein
MGPNGEAANERVRPSASRVAHWSVIPAKPSPDNPALSRDDDNHRAVLKIGCQGWLFLLFFVAN